MRTKKHIQAANYFAFLGDVQRLALKGVTWDKLPIKELHKAHHIGGWPKDLLKDMDLKQPTSMERAVELMNLAYDYGRQMKSTRDERGAHRAQKGQTEAPSCPELQAIKEEAERFFDQFIQEKEPEVTAPETDTLPFMTELEMIAHLRRRGYKIYKEVTL